MFSCPLMLKRVRQEDVALEEGDFKALVVFAKCCFVASLKSSLKY